MMFLIPYNVDWDNEDHINNMVDRFLKEYQPERSKREDCEKHMHFRHSSSLKDKNLSEDEWKCDYCDAIIRRCGALNTMET